MTSNFGKFEIHVLRKLYRQVQIGEDYIPIADLVQGLEPHERDKTLLIKAIKNLGKNNLIELHKNGACISLNRKKIPEIERILDSYH